MGLLEDLKAQADAMRTQDALRSQRHKVNAAAIDIALRQAFYYLNEMFKQLNIVKPPYPGVYNLRGAATIDSLVQSNYRVEYRTSQREDSEHFENLILSFRRSKPDQLTVKRGAEEIERFRDLLFQNNLRYTSETIRNDRRVVVSETFFIANEIICGCDIVGNYQDGNIHFKLRNVEDFGLTTHLLAPGDVTDAALEAFANLLIGTPSTFDQHTRRLAAEMYVTAPLQRVELKIPDYPVAPEEPEPAAKPVGMLGSWKSKFKREA